jgi:Host cell surface-exposed lipoprotein
VLRPRVRGVKWGMTKRTAPLALALAATAAVSLAACGPSSSSSSAASAPAASPKASAAPKAPAAVAGTVSAKAACQALADWENGSSSQSVADDASLRKTFAGTTPALAASFADWTSDIRGGSVLVPTDAALMSAECSSAGVTVFPSPSSPAAPPAPAAPASSAPAGTASQAQALAAAEGYLGDGQGFSRQGLIDQLDSAAGNNFSVADATWAVDHSDANWDDQAVDCAKGYMSDGQGFSREGLIEQMTSAFGNKFTEAQAEQAATAVGL